VRGQVIFYCKGHVRNVGGQNRNGTNWGNICPRIVVKYYFVLFQKYTTVKLILHSYKIVQFLESYGRT